MLYPLLEHPILGQVGICQSSLDPRFFKFRFSKTDQTMRTCFIPTSRDYSGKSVYIGYAVCTFHNEGSIYSNHPNIPMEKNRQGPAYDPNAYSNLPLNGMMIMKEPMIYEYFDCMDAPTPEAFSALCSQFASKGEYIDVAF